MLGRYILALLVLATSSQSLAAPYPQDEGGQQSAPAPVAAPSNAPDPTASTPDYPSNPASFGEPVSQPSQSAAPAAAGLTGEVVSDIPLSCVAGCSLSQTLYEDCVGNDDPSCSRFCTTANYTRALTCLDCLTVQGSSLNTKQLQSALNAYTTVCKRVRGSRFQGTPSLPAGATTTEGTSTSLGKGEGLPTWSGFRLGTDAAIPTDVGKLGERISRNRQG